MIFFLRWRHLKISQNSMDTAASDTVQIFKSTSFNFCIKTPQHFRVGHLKTTSRPASSCLDSWVTFLWYFRLKASNSSSAFQTSKTLPRTDFHYRAVPTTNSPCLHLFGQCCCTLLISLLFDSLQLGMTALQFLLTA